MIGCNAGTGQSHLPVTGTARGTGCAIILRAAPAQTRWINQSTGTVNFHAEAIEHNGAQLADVGNSPVGPKTAAVLPSFRVCHACITGWIFPAQIR